MHRVADARIRFRLHSVHDHEVIVRRVAWITIALLLSTPSGALAQDFSQVEIAQSQEKPDFSGTWILDRDASQITTAEGLAGLGGSGAPENLYITQAANGSMVISSEVNAAQPRAYQLDSQSTVPAAEGATMTVRSRWDGSVLVTEGSHDLGDGGSIGVREVLSLSADGQTLTLEVTTTTPSGNGTNSLVYRRATSGRGS